MKKAAIALALLSALCLSACRMMKAPLTYDELGMTVVDVDRININGIICEPEDGEELFMGLLADLEAMYEGKLCGGEMKFVVLWWYRNGNGGYICVPPGLTYHSDMFTLGFGGIAELGIVTLKEDDETEKLIGFSRYNGHGFGGAIATLENYEFVHDPEDLDKKIGILKEYSYMICGFKVHTVSEYLDFGVYEEE
ncbi:MAG: hypothetical protein E3J72_04850 [Planctomycetota bacterium]|nr:MAG: hypothetical protein E3J72_04850 [Planctomycetota bacterium]